MIYRNLMLVFLAIAAFACSQEKEKPKAEGKTEEVVFNQALTDELEGLYEIDQLAARNTVAPEGYKHLSEEEWLSFKDSVYRAHRNRAGVIFNEFGYPGYDLVSKKGQKTFWLIVQHSDFDPQFQEKVLAGMALEVEKGNANSRDYGLLTDRVKLNTGQKQIYGTQVRYNSKICQAYPKPLEDSVNVNARRAALGFEPLEEYLNVMAEMHFEMNKENMLKRGLKGPYLYKVTE